MAIADQQENARVGGRCLALVWLSSVVALGCPATGSEAGEGEAGGSESQGSESTSDEESTGSGESEATTSEGDTTASTESTTTSEDDTTTSTESTTTSNEPDPSCIPPSGCEGVEGVEALGPQVYVGGFEEYPGGIAINVADDPFACGVFPGTHNCGGDCQENYDAHEINLPLDAGMGVYDIEANPQVSHTCPGGVSDCMGNGGRSVGGSTIGTVEVVVFTDSCIAGHVYGSDDCDEVSFAAARCE